MSFDITLPWVLIDGIYFDTELFIDWLHLESKATRCIGALRRNYAMGMGFVRSHNEYDVLFLAGIIRPVSRTQPPRTTTQPTSEATTTAGVPASTAGTPAATTSGAVVGTTTGAQPGTTAPSKSVAHYLYL